VILPGDVESFVKKPAFKMSWLILFLNLIVFTVFSIEFESWPSGPFAEKLSDPRFKTVVYEMYKQTLDPVEVKSADVTTEQILTVALRDQNFKKRLAHFPFKGNDIEIVEAKSILFDFFNGYHRSPQYQFGLSANDSSPWSWLTYQFVHASLLHLAGNLFIIFLTLSYLEKKVSSGWLLSVYLLSGFVGGMFFLKLEPSSGLSMVGASASAFGLLGFLLVLDNSKLMPWFFLIAPIKGGYGRIHLPVFFILPVLLISEFLTLLKDTSGVSTSIAVSAHVGGAVAGMFLACTYLLSKKYSKLTQNSEAELASDEVTHSNVA
jgi:membrane associated rhomboid family serine protease